MQKIRIEVHGFNGSIDELLTNPGSGFKAADDNQAYEFRRPMESQVGDIVAIAGLIINAAQLAIVLFGILHPKADSKSSDSQQASIYVETAKGTRKLSGDNVEQIRAILETLSDDD